MPWISLGRASVGPWMVVVVKLQLIDSERGNCPHIRKRDIVMDVGPSILKELGHSSFSTNSYFRLQLKRLLNSILL